MSDAPSGQRLDALEARIAYQDETIETLNATITAQWKQLDVMTRQIAMLIERLQSVESNPGTPAHEPPPHY